MTIEALILNIILTIVSLIGLIVAYVSRREVAIDPPRLTVIKHRFTWLTIINFVILASLYSYFVYRFLSPVTESSWIITI